MNKPRRGGIISLIRVRYFPKVKSPNLLILKIYVTFGKFQKNAFNFFESFFKIKYSENVLKQKKAVPSELPLKKIF